MRLMTTVAAAAAALLLVGAGSAAHAGTTLSNTPIGSNIATFGYPDSQTYGQVFTAPVTGSLTSFTLWLNGGVGSLYGGVGQWNGSSAFSLNGGVSNSLYQSGTVASNSGGPYTFNTDVSVVAGQLYVAYISVFGLNPAGLSKTSMPRGNDTAGINYFVWNNGPSPLSANWNYFDDRGDAQFSATFTQGAAVPEPTTWALMLIGFLSLGSALRRQRRAQTAFA